jgi:hypothetical protein
LSLTEHKKDGYFKGPRAIWNIGRYYEAKTRQEP